MTDEHGRRRRESNVDAAETEKGVPDLCPDLYISVCMCVCVYIYPVKGRRIFGAC